MKRNAMLVAMVCLFSVGFALVAAAQKEPVDTPATDQNVNVTGSYTASLYMQLAAHQYGANSAQTEKIVKEPWAFKQDGAKVTGTEKTEKAELPITATVDGRVLRGYVTDGDKRYLINVNVDPDDGAMHGSIRMGIHEYLLNLVKAK